MSDSDVIRFQCPNCPKQLRAAASSEGKRIRCPSCRAIAPVPMRLEDDEPIHSDLSEITPVSPPNRRRLWVAGGGVLLLVVVASAWLLLGKKSPTGTGGSKTWKNNYPAFAEAVKRGDSLQENEQIEWEGRYIGMVPEAELLPYSGETVVKGDGADKLGVEKIAIPFRDRRPACVRFDFPALVGQSGEPGDLWLVQSDSEKNAWATISGGQSMRIRGTFKYIVTNVKMRRESGEPLPVRFVAWIKDVVPVSSK